MASKDLAPTKKLYRESVTPHRLAVAVLITKFCEYRDNGKYHLYLVFVKNLVK